MTSDPDEALRWEGDDEPPALPSGWTAVGRGSESVAQVEADGTVTAHPPTATAAPATSESPTSGSPVSGSEAGEQAPMSTALLVALGILGGVYLLYTVGWAIGGYRLQVAALVLSPSLTSIMYQVALWAAVLAPALWFVATLVLTRRSRSWVRLAALLAGAVLLVPWPFVMLGAWGS